MKLRILFSVLFLFLCASLVEAQKQPTAIKIWLTDQNGTLKYVSDYIGTNQTPLPVHNPPVLYYKASYTATLTTEIDTIPAPTGTELYWTFSVTPNDTMEYSLSASFTNPQKILTSGTDGFTNFSVVNFPAVYVRRVGVGTVTYSYKAYGF